MKNFIICLSKIKSSMETAVKVKEWLEEAGEDVELFEGSYGNEVKESYNLLNRRYHPWNFKHGPTNLFTDEFRDAQQSAGVMGCFDSHFRLWQKCVELDEPIMIFEDDVLFTRKFIPIEWKDILITVFGNPQKSFKYYHYLENPEGVPAAMPYYQSSMPGTPGYAITPDAAKKLIEEYSNTFLPSDNSINQFLVTIEVHSHVMGRALVKSDGKKSLVRGKNNYWETDPENE